MSVRTRRPTPARPAASSSAANRRQVSGPRAASVRHNKTTALDAVSAEANEVRLNWYERLLPECLLNITAPITGYEARLDSDIDEDEYDILERNRLKRNKRIRRRLMTVMLGAIAGAAFLAYKGNFRPKTGGVKAAVDSVKHGIQKSIHDISKL